MEFSIDKILDNIFGGISSQLFIVNIIFSIILIVGGIYLLRDKSSKVKQTIGLICIVIGCLGILIRVLQWFI